MADRTAASVGLVVAGVAFAAAAGASNGGGLAGVLEWPHPHWIVVAGFAGVSLVGFGVRRHGYLDRRLGSLLAGGAGGGATVGGAYTMFAPAVGGGEGTVAIGPALAATAGLLAVLLADADRRAIPGERLRRMAAATATAAAVGVSGLVAIVVWANVIGAVVLSATPGGIDSSTATVLSTVALGLGTGTVAALYLRMSDRDLSFVDLRRPGIHDGAYVVGGVVAIVGLNVAIGAAFQRIGLESAQHSIVRTAESDPTILLVLIPLAYLIIGPGEELLYRNIVQKSLYGTFSRPGAIVTASAIFAVVHLFAYADPGGNLLATFNTLVVVFTLSLVLGTVYDRTRNVAVPALVHGSFDAIAFAVTYAQLTGV